MLKRIPITRIVVYGPGVAGGRTSSQRGAPLSHWKVEAFDETGSARSGLNDRSRESIERDIAEWWPGVPIEYKVASSEGSPRGFTVRAKSGRVVRRFATREAAERFVRGRRTAHSPSQRSSPKKGIRRSAEAYDFLRWMPGWTITSDDLGVVVAHRMSAVQGQKPGPSVEFFRMAPREWRATFEGREGWGTTPAAAAAKLGIGMFAGHGMLSPTTPWALARDPSPENRHNKDARLLHAWHEASAAVNRAKQAFDEAWRTDLRQVEPARKVLHRAVVAEQRAHRKAAQVKGR